MRTIEGFIIVARIGEHFQNLFGQSKNVTSPYTDPLTMNNLTLFPTYEDAASASEKVFQERHTPRIAKLKLTIAEKGPGGIWDLIKEVTELLAEEPPWILLMQADDYWTLFGFNRTGPKTATGVSCLGEEGVEPFQNPHTCRSRWSELGRQSGSFTTVAHIELEYLDPS